MKKPAKASIEVRGTVVNIVTQNEEDYICLTDIARFKDPERTDYLISNWMRNRNTVEFLEIWEQLHNPGFNPIEFDGIKKQTGLNSFILTVKQWSEFTGAIGLISKAGRYGGTYAHKDIAFEFASWISVEFKLYLIKEFQRLKDDENDRLKLDWNLQRTLAKINYRKRAEYGEKIFYALSRKLTAEFGRGYGQRNLARMVQFAEVFPDPKILTSLMTKLGWTHFLHIIHVTSYWTKTLPKDLLRKKLHQAVATARANLEERKQRANGLGINSAATKPPTDAPTRQQGQFLAFIREYMMRNEQGLAPTHAAFQKFFDLTPPSVNSMLIRLEQRGFIRRSPGQARGIQLIITPDLIPPLERSFKF